MSSTNSSQTCRTKNRLRKSAISYIVLVKLVLQPVARLTVKTVFEGDCSSKIWSKSPWRVFLPDIYKVRHNCPWYLLNSSVERDGTCYFVFPIRPSLCTFVLSNQLRVLIHERDSAVFENSLISSSHLYRGLPTGLLVLM